jgi:hypothetical protein
MSTPLSKQIEVVNEEEADLVSEYTTTDTSNFEAHVPLFLGTSSEKPAPDNLAEMVDNPRYRSGAVLMIVDANRQDDIKYITNKFYLQSMSIQNRERVQMLETFDVPTLSFFGKTIRVYQFSAIAVDYPSQDIGYKTMHQSSILDLYDKHLRGTKLVENDNIAIMQVRNHSIYGYPINMSTSYTANTDNMATFNFSFVVAKHDLDLPGVVSEKELERLYTNRLELENEYIDAIDSLLIPINNLLHINSEPVQAMKGSVSRIQLPGIDNREGRKSSISPLEFERFSHQLLSANFPDAFNIIEEKAHTIATGLKNMLDSGYTNISPKLVR